MYVNISPDGNKILLKNRMGKSFDLLISEIPTDDTPIIPFEVCLPGITARNPKHHSTNVLCACG